MDFPFFDFDKDFLTSEDLLFLAGASGSLIEATATGNPATFATDVQKPFVSLIAPFTPVQAGTGDPSPDNVRPISGFTGINAVRCGVNLWDEEWEVGAIDDYGQNTSSSSNFRSTNYIPVVPGMAFYLHYELPNGQTPNTNIHLFYYDRNKAYIGDAWGWNAAITVPADVYYIRFYGDSKFGAQNDHVSFNFPSTETGYNAYNGNSYAVSFHSGQTIYGGSLDLVSGVLTVEWKTVDMGSLTFYKTSATSSVGGSVFSVAIESVGDGLFARERNEQNPVISDIFKTAPDSTWYVNSLNNNEMFSNETSLFIAASEYDTKEEFTEAVSGHVLAYKLATPQTIQLDPVTIQTLIGNNTVWTDTNGTNTVVYLKKA